MNITFLESNFQRLIEYLKQNHYQKDSLVQTRKCIRAVLKHGESVKDYEQLFWDEVQRRGYKPDEHRFKTFRVYLGNVKRFHLEGKYPDRQRHCSLFPMVPAEDTLIQRYGDLVRFHQQEQSRLGLISAKSIYTRTRALIRFLLFLQSLGIVELNGVTEPVVLSFFHDGEKQIRGKDFCFLLRSSLVFIQKYHLDQEIQSNVLRIIKWLPQIKSGSKPYPYLKKEEFEKIREVLLDESNKLTHRDRLIGWILFFWGLRGTDIVSLTPDNVDWENELVSLIQSKTGYPLSLPINVHIGNELFDYLTREREGVSMNGVILRQAKAKDRPLKSVAHVLSKIFKKCGIRQNGVKGLRLMRHNLVTTLLGHSEACEVVSSIVGHKSPESLKPYADSDIEHLRECALSIEDYPMPKNYFSI